MIFSAKYFDSLTPSELYEILRSRCAVFAVEQNIVCQDMDRIDYKSLHCMMMEKNGTVSAYLRAFYTDDADTVAIGRVLTLEHGKGTGRILMEKSLFSVIELMKPKKLVLHSQCHAIGFYEKFGFEVCSEEFMEEGILHVEMKLELERRGEI
jgi:ElaA protein